MKLTLNKICSSSNSSAADWEIATRDEYSISSLFVSHTTCLPSKSGNICRGCLHALNKHINIYKYALSRTSIIIFNCLFNPLLRTVWILKVSFLH